VGIPQGRHPFSHWAAAPRRYANHARSRHRAGRGGPSPAPARDHRPRRADRGQVRSGRAAVAVRLREQGLHVMGVVLVRKAKMSLDSARVWFPATVDASGKMLLRRFPTNRCSATPVTDPRAVLQVSLGGSASAFGSLLRMVDVDLAAALRPNCCRSRYSARFSQNNPRWTCRIRPPQFARLVGTDCAPSRCVVVLAANGQLLPLSRAASAAGQTRIADAGLTLCERAQAIVDTLRYSASCRPNPEPNVIAHNARTDKHLADSSARSYVLGEGVKNVEA
jgi:hypothetical protein